MKIYFRLLRFVRPYWKRLVGSIFCTVLFSLFSGMSVYLFIPLLDILFHPEKLAGHQSTSYESGLPFGLGSVVADVKRVVLSFMFEGTQMEALLRVCIIIFVAFLCKNVFGYFQSFLMNYVEEGVIRDIRNKLYRHLHDLPLAYFSNERTGGLISRITSDVSLINGGVSAGFVTMTREPLLILVFLSLAFSLSWQLTLIALVVFPLALVIIGLIAVRLHRERGISQERLADITSILQETISGVKVVKAFAMEEFENKKFVKQTQRYFRSLIKITRMRDLSSPSTELLSVAAGAFIIWYGGRLVLVEGTMNASEFLGFLILIFQIMPPIKELASVNNRIQESSAAGKRIFEILDTEPTIRNSINAVTVDEFERGLEFKGVHFAYDTTEGGREHVLEDISLEVKKGELLAIVGPSGSGKTTMVDLVPRFYDPTSGSILLDGHDLREIDVQSLREKVGIVTQETILFHDTVRNNIAYGLDDCPMEKIIAAAKAANAHGFISVMPQGYDTLIGERGVKLSGGERQRMSLARAILKNPPILILDEATSALDTESEILVQEAIEHLMAGRTSLVIAHRLSTVQHADRIIVLDHGRIVESGRHQELLANEQGMYRKLYNLQFRV